MEDSRLVKQIYKQCKDRTGGQRGSFCYSIKKLLIKFDLEHLWKSELIGELKDWESQIQACVRQFDQDSWSVAVQMKPKLRTYNLFKAEVRREEYLSWEITDEQRVLYARLRSGSHQLRIERGRWDNEVEAERLCKVCGTGKIENEKHFLLECYVFERFRRNMYRRILQETTYDLVRMNLRSR